MKNTAKDKLNEVAISTMPVEIKVMTVGGKRLTLSVFNQIPERDTFLLEMNGEDRLHSYLGWVDRDCPFVLFTIEGVLLKCPIKAVEQETNWDWLGFGQKYKMSYKIFYALVSPFLGFKNQIYISI